MGDEILHAGHLLKQGKLRKNWTDRKFVLSKSALRYYK